MKQFISQPFHCIAACIEYIVYHKANKDISQFSISEYFGISLPNDIFNTINIYNKKNTEDSNLWGISIGSDELNSYFESINVPIKADYASSLTFEEWSFEDYLKSCLTKSELLMCTLEYNYIFDKSNTELFGHAIVIESLDSKNKEYVRCFDPGPKNYGYKLLSIYDLYIASKRKKGGLFRFY